MDYGIFGFISKPLLKLMKFLHGLFGNWGVAIIALTIIMRLLMLPFNVVSFKSARAMQKIQPQLTAVREKYKNDPLAVNRETMALMKQNNANPLSSCLPMLIQIPIFFALWKTIGSSIEIYQQPFFGWISDLSSYDRFFVLPILMGITMFFQQKLTPTTMDPMQAKILNYMPLLFSLFMISLPSGLTQWGPWLRCRRLLEPMQEPIQAQFQGLRPSINRGFPKLTMNRWLDIAGDIKPASISQKRTCRFFFLEKSVFWPKYEQK